MALKIYNKRGAVNYTEKRLIKKIQAALEKKFEKEPSLESQFIPANNIDELQTLHNLYCGEEIEFEEVPNKEVEHKEFRDGMKEDIESRSQDEKESTDSLVVDDEEDVKTVDPFNRDTTIVRDYVMNDGFKEGEEREGSKKTSFAEPTSFEESFEMEGSDIGTDKRDNANKKKDKPKEPSANPSFDDMSSGRKKRSTKKFAKYIVEGVCMLAEKGFVWWTTKNITEEKLVEYELSGEYDFNVLLTLETGQEVYVKQWFKQQRATADQLSKFDQEEKDDLAEALAEVLNEKGFAPTPMQECLIIGAKVLGGKFLIAAQMSAGINNVLAQLKATDLPSSRGQVKQQEQVVTDAPQERREEINNPITEWEENIMDESADAVGNPAVDNQLTITE